MPATFFYNSPYSRKYDLIRLTLYHWQPCILKLGDNPKKAHWQISSGGLALVPVAVAKFFRFGLATHCYQVASYEYYS